MTYPGMAFVFVAGVGLVTILHYTFTSSNNSHQHNSHGSNGSGPPPEISNFWNVSNNKFKRRMSDTTLYFAYGSNLLQSRIQMNNPTAVFKDIGKLEHYRLDFIDTSKNWKGTPATIVSIPNSWVWGAVWEIKSDELENLDIQEGVHLGQYKAFNVNVTNADGKVYTCRVYQNTKTVENPTELSKLPEDRLPSLTYLRVIVKGALDCGLPDEYIQFLKSIKHNGYMDNQHPITQEVSHIQLD